MSEHTRFIFGLLVNDSIGFQLAEQMPRKSTDYFPYVPSDEVGSEG